ncbi:hypothetical protein ACOSQ4_000205 [Xanthoceras sorbifolium]
MVITDQLTKYKTINILLKQCKTIQQVHQVHAHFITTGLLSLNHSHNQSKILNAITTIKPASSTANLLSYAVLVFNNIPNPSTFCYNTIIRAHTLLSSPVNALLFFSQMRSVSIPPDFHSFPFVLKACSQLGSLSSAQTLHSQALKFGFVYDLFVLNSLIHMYSVSHRFRDAHNLFDESSHRDVVSYNALIDGYVKAGDVGKARELFNKMPFRDAVSWGTLVAGYAKSDQCNEAIHLFNKMLELNIRPDNIALVSALSACAQLGELECGKRIHDYIERSKIRVDSFLSTGLVDVYAKCGYIETAIKIFESSQGKNLCTWNAMLVGLAMHGHGQLSLDYFSRMIEAGVEPDGVTFLGVLVGCSHAGLVNEARELFDKMESVYGVSRELKHFGCMADLLGRAGLIKEAMEMIKKMPMGCDVSVWSGLLGGCRIHGNVEVAEQAAEHVMELKPEDGGVYKIMADLYANAERWEDVVKIRRSMDAGKVKKIAGCSLIQLNGVMHEFVASDDLHPETDEIYFVLNAIRKHQYESC